ncbi:hypothetical protein [Flavobacterium sp. UBA6135]|uniref:hypothetical protein n=1 Tax=Flavobacterium sp. UBA6135 TaxID=1946553 RepID=UPI0025C54691|nr:hypothetical protein [Flavobacterium sp. UBA6135]
MRNLFFLIICICSTSVLKAQEPTESNAKTNKIALRFSNGFAFPFSDFKSSEKASFGFAKMGYKGAIDFSHQLKKNIAAVLIVDFNIHATDAEKIAASYLDSNPSYTSVEVKSGNYSVLSLLVGGDYTVALNASFYIQGQVAFGLATVKGPENQIEVSSSSPFEEFKSSGRATSFAYQGKASFNYAITTPVAVGLYTSYYETNPDFKVAGSSIKQKINSFSTGIQLTYKL